MKIVVATHVLREGSGNLDPVVKQVADALEKGGHEVRVLAVHNDIGKLVSGLTEPRPDLVFNLMETFGKTQLGGIGVAGLLDLLGVRHVGSGPGELYLQEDKALSKRLLAYEGLRYPGYAVFGLDGSQGDVSGLRMPLIVKPLRMDASIGIDAGAIVRDQDSMRERVALVHQKVKDAALVEEFVEGREFHVGIVGNREAQAFPPIEIDFSGLPEGAPTILDHPAKWDRKSPEYQGTRSVVADLPEDLRKRLQDVALRAYRALRVRDYGRVDLRLDPSGEVFVIEANASCYLEKRAELALAASAAGIDHTTLVNRIAGIALAR